MTARFDRARRLAAEAGLDGLYVTAGANFRWLTGEEAHPGGWPLWASVIVVPVDGEPSMVASRMHADIFDVEGGPIDQVFTYVDGESPVKALRDALAAAGVSGGALGADDALWFGDVELLREVAPAIALRRASPVFDRLRAVKDAVEIEHLRKASVAHDAGYARAVEVLRPGISLARLGAEVTAAMLEAGSGDLPQSGFFHHLSPEPLAVGAMVDVDLFPGSHAGYRADSARVLFCGEASAQARRAYAASLTAWEASMAAVRPGASAEEIHRACAAAMADAGFEQVWKVGHGVGLAPIHEPPLLQFGNEEPLVPGMVFTIDPGAFVARDTPVHIEDTVLVTETGVESLTRFPRDIDALIVG
jgi:Xaa-Pro aminopeptidase